MRFPGNSSFSSLLSRDIHDLCLCAIATDLDTPTEEHNPEGKFQDGADGKAGHGSVVQAIVSGTIVVVVVVIVGVIVVDTAGDATVPGIEETPSDGEEHDPRYEEAENQCPWDWFVTNACQDHAGKKGLVRKGGLGPMGRHLIESGQRMWEYLITQSNDRGLE